VFLVPKIGKEKREEIINILNQGYNIKETAEKTGTSRNYVSKIKKELKQKEKLITEAKVEAFISSESRQILNNLMGLLGTPNLDETIKQLDRDVRVIMPIKYEFDHDFKQSISEVFKYIYNEYKENKVKNDNIMTAQNNNWIQGLILRIWMVEEAVFAFYKISGFDGTIIDMMSTAVINSFTNLGWKVKYYFNEVLEKNQPILITPDGIEMKFPLEET
jgi:hypothetical protein